MNVLYIAAKNEWGGVATWMDLTAAGLRDRGHNVWIAAEPNGEIPARSRIPEAMIPVRFGKRFSMATVSALKRILREKSIDVAVVNSAREMAMGGRAARACQVPVVRRIGMAHDVFRSRRYQSLHRRFVDHAIVPGENMRREILSKAPWLEEGRIETIHNGRNPVAIERNVAEALRAELGFAPDDCVAGCFARFHEVKGQIGLIESLGRIRDAVPNLKLLLAGDGARRAEAMQLAERLELGGRVRFPGFLDTRKPYAAVCDFHVLNSSEEGFANGIVESMAFGRPVIASRVGGADEIIEHGANGWLFDHGDDASLDALLTGSADSPELLTMGEAARRTVAASFSLDGMLDKVETTFSMVAKAAR